MAPNLKLFSLLWLVAACLAPQATAITDEPGDSSTTPKVQTTVPGDSSTTPKDPTTVPGDSSTTPKDPTTVPGDSSTTPKDPTTVPGDSSTTPKDPTTVPGDSSTTPKDPTTVPGDSSTTPKDPTTVPGDSSTTPKDPTTVPGDSSTTPKDPTTVPGDSSTTPKDPTTVPGDSSTTPKDPTTVPGDSSTTPKDPTPAPTKPYPCKSMPCRGGSTCVPRFNGQFECLCLPGNVYNNDSNTCDGAKVFPGQLTLAKKYNDNYDDSTSEDFLSVSEEIVAELKKVLAGTVGYSKSTVQKLKPSNSARVWSRATNTILAEVENIFEPNAAIKAEAVTETLEKAIEDSDKGSFLKGAAFLEEDLCSRNPCDGNTTDCTPKDGSFECKCEEGYINTDYSDRICITACPNGQKLGTSGCVNCPFGYTGFNCNESWRLAVVIVGSVLGVVVLSSGTVIGVLALRPAKKSSKKKKDEETAKPYVSNFSTKAPLVNKSTANGRGPSVNGSANGRGPSVNGSANAYANAGMPRIPRATTTSSMEHRTNLEMTPSNSRQNLVPTGRNTRLYDDPDDINPYTQARPQNNPYAQNRPQNNPYAQNRPQNNPYSANQGHTNPYFTNDNGRRLY